VGKNSPEKSGATVPLKLTQKKYIVVSFELINKVNVQYTHTSFAESFSKKKRKNTKNNLFNTAAIN
jgi:hypothetical protein